MTPTSTPGLRTVTSRGSLTFLPPSDGILEDNKWSVGELLNCNGVAWIRHSSHTQCIVTVRLAFLPDEVVRAGSGRGLLGGGSECALVLFAECIDSGVIVRGGGSAPLGSRLSADWLQTGTAPIKEVTNRKVLAPSIKLNCTKPLV